ncbi:hypothetical protein [Pseudonocardia nigra]|uniref:hypothetical protein n=1 Tax=Pseudonocardia nigra TaxID=1921578 RepID=UPI001C5D1A2D|nr:hypothetical protein [Pseudonocardia nigra]
MTLSIDRPDTLTAAAMQRAAAALENLTLEQLEDLAEGRGRLVFQAADRGARRRPQRCGPQHADGDVAAAVEAINALTTSAEVAEYLQANDRQLTMPVLREVARALGPTVSANAASKAQLKRNIIAGTAGFRQRSAAMSRGAWS